MSDDYELTQGQESALAMVKRLLACDRTTLGIIGGYGGTGKTYILKKIAEQVGTPIIITPTGKAAQRVHQLTGLAASTIHRWQYRPLLNDDTGGLEFERLAPSEMSVGEAGLVIVDEGSMVGKDLFGDVWEACQDLRLKLLVIGDSFQLPPVEPGLARGAKPWSLLDPKNTSPSHYVLLDEIVRQAADSVVIKIATAIRAGDVLAAMKMTPQIPTKDFIHEAAKVRAKGGGVIVHRNATRHWANAGIRAEMGYSDSSLSPGEPLLVRKNCYQLGVFNGETLDFVDWAELSNTKHTCYDRWKKIRETSRFGIARLRNPDTGQEVKAVLAQEEVWGRMNCGTAAIEATAEVLYRGVPFLHCNFGYVSTVHSAQGSENDTVLLGLEPSVRFDGDRREEGLRFLYTSATRAREQFLVSLGVSPPQGVLP